MFPGGCAIDDVLWTRLAMAEGECFVETGHPALVLTHFARFTSRGSPAACDGAGHGASSSRARPSSTARL